MVVGSRWSIVLLDTGYSILDEHLHRTPYGGESRNEERDYGSSKAGKDSSCGEGSDQ
jgi:hypothetical protein